MRGHVGFINVQPMEAEMLLFRQGLVQIPALAMINGCFQGFLQPLPVSKCSSTRQLLQAAAIVLGTLIHTEFQPMELHALLNILVKRQLDRF